MRGWKLRLEFKLQDAWVGAFWRGGRHVSEETGLVVRTLEIWLCLLPCMPIHVTRIWLTEPTLEERRELGWRRLEKRL
jgi:hypothetical protein